ncbi:MAG: hypothetical protein KJ906_03330 [Nanoarchaeota archaeon]|nr:hypothetical protein [Nanoarchaeota archaeon]
MKVVIKKKNGGTAILISFDTNSEKFESRTERNKFFSDLHGRKQIIIKEKKRYEYRRPGVLDEVPHIPVDSSVFIIMQEHMKRMEQFFNEWDDKVLVKTFPVLLNEDEVEQLEEQNSEPEEEVPEGFKLIKIKKRGNSDR